METKHIKSAHEEGMDAGRFDVMLNSDTFARYLLRLAKELERARAACESAKDDLEVRRAQGAAAALRMALELPKTILSELRRAGPASGE